MKTTFRKSYLWQCLFLKSCYNLGHWKLKSSTWKRVTNSSHISLIYRGKRWLDLRKHVSKFPTEMGSEHDFGGTIDFILEKLKKIVTSALWRNPNGDARLKTDVWHIWQKESTCASKFFFAILPFRSWPDKEQQLSSFSGTHMAYFLLVSSIPNVFFQLYHLAKEFRSPSFKRFFFKTSTTAIFVFHFQ